MSSGDRVGLAWRDELAAQIFLHLDSIDHLEIIAEREMSASHRRLDALRDLACQIPLSLHGVSLGLASSVSVSDARLERIARLIERVQPDHWSEHLSFVRAGGIEIGHLAAAPYAPPTLAGALRNLARAREVVGAPPQLENIATLLTPPGSCWTESEFICRVLNYMDSQGYDTVVPQHPGDAVEERPLMDFTPGYVLRALDSLPKQGSRAPWRLKQNYLFDLGFIRRGKVDDDTLHFTKHRAVVTANA